MQAGQVELHESCAVCWWTSLTRQVESNWTAASSRWSWTTSRTRFMCPARTLCCMYRWCLVRFRQGDSGRAVRCRWCCSPRWCGSRTASLCPRPPTTSRTRIFRKPRGTSKVSPRNSASSPTAAHSSLELLMSSRSLCFKRLLLSIQTRPGFLSHRGLLYADEVLMMVT